MMCGSPAVNAVMSRIDPNHRTKECPACGHSVEDTKHVLLECSYTSTLRDELHDCIHSQCSCKHDPKCLEFYRKLDEEGQQCLLLGGPVDGRRVDAEVNRALGAVIGKMWNARCKALTKRKLSVLPDQQHPPSGSGSPSASSEDSLVEDSEDSSDGHADSSTSEESEASSSPSSEPDDSSSDESAEPLRGGSGSGTQRTLGDFWKPKPPISGDVGEKEEEVILNSRAPSSPRPPVPHTLPSTPSSSPPKLPTSAALLASGVWRLMSLEDTSPT